MRYTLGSVSFEIPATFRDDTNYSYESPAADESVQITLHTHAVSPADVLSSVADGLRKLYGPLLIYLNPTSAVRGDGVIAPSLEGDVNLPGPGSTTQRIAVAALAPASTTANLLYLGRRAPFLQHFRRIVSTVLLDEERPLPPSPPALIRLRAGPFSLAVPPTWSYPTTHLFTALRSDRVRVRATLDAAATSAADVSLEDELALPPGASFRLLSEDLFDVPPDASIGRWLVEHTMDGRVQVTHVRRACFLPQAGPPLNMYGRAPAAESALLDSVFSKVPRLAEGR